MEKLFKLKQYGTTTRTEIFAGITTFFTMAYIIFVNPSILSNTGMSYSGVFVATILASVIGTLIMAFVANVPYALAPGMGLNALFTFTVCGVMGFKWQEALAMVFICGVINIIITVTGFRRMIIRSMPKVLQSAIGAGIGLFIAYIGFNDAGFLSFSSGVPAMVTFSHADVVLTAVGVVIIIILMVRKVKGAILIGILAVTVITLLAILLGLNPQSVFPGQADAAGNLATTSSTFFGSIFSKSIGASLSGIKDTAFKLDFKGLFADPGRTMLALTAVIAFILTDIFDALGTFIGTGRRSGIFDANDEKLLYEGKGLKMQSRMDRALFADLTATIFGSFLGTSNTTTYVESSAGIAEGGRTGLTSVTVAVLFLLCLLLAPVAGLIPSAATAPALIVVGVLMIASIADIDWHNFEDAAVAFLAAVIMPFSYSITNGIAFGFIFFVIIKLVRGKIKEIHPIVYVFTALFIINFILQAVYIPS
ncbi:MAG: NCS2 family permease [Defluviitaleaceae bacterium]|nr:NCS2 family permease [Defluviitaleaceae bacterium]